MTTAGPAAGEGLAYVANIGHGTGETVQFRHHQGVAGANRHQRPVQTRPAPVGAGQPVVEVDPVDSDTQARQQLPLPGEVLLVGLSWRYGTAVARRPLRAAAG